MLPGRRAGATGLELSEVQDADSDLDLLRFELEEMLNFLYCHGYDRREYDESAAEHIGLVTCLGCGHSSPK